MTLPTCNPIDFGWFAKGMPIDHIGSIEIECKVCDKSVRHEKFLILIGFYGGVGAPFFAKPFLKHSSTRGKVGGVRGHVIQCTSCNSLKAFDEDGVKALEKAGLGPELVSPQYANDFRIRQAELLEKEQHGALDAESTTNLSSRIKKTYE